MKSTSDGRKSERSKPVEPPKSKTDFLPTLSSTAKPAPYSSSLRASRPSLSDSKRLGSVYTSRRTSKTRAGTSTLPSVSSDAAAVALSSVSAVSAPSQNAFTRGSRKSTTTQKSGHPVADRNASSSPSQFRLPIPVTATARTRRDQTVGLHSQKAPSSDSLSASHSSSSFSSRVSFPSSSSAEAEPVLRTIAKTQSLIHLDVQDLVAYEYVEPVTGRWSWALGTVASIHGLRVVQLLKWTRPSDEPNAEDVSESVRSMRADDVGTNDAEDGGGRNGASKGDSDAGKNVDKSRRDSQNESSNDNDNNSNKARGGSNAESNNNDDDDDGCNRGNSSQSTGVGEGSNVNSKPDSGDAGASHGAPNSNTEVPASKPYSFPDHHSRRHDDHHMTSHSGSSSSSKINNDNAPNKSNHTTHRSNESTSRGDNDNNNNNAASIRREHGTTSKKETAQAKLKRLRARRLAIERQLAQIHNQQVLFRVNENIAVRHLKAEVKQANVKLYQAKRRVRGIADREWVELRSYSQPPAIVQMTLRAMMLIVNVPFASWADVQNTMRQRDFHEKVVQYDVTQTLPPSVHERLIDEFISRPEFTYENAIKGSQALYTILNWINAIVTFNEAQANLTTHANPVEVERRRRSSVAGANVKRAELEAELRRVMAEAEPMLLAHRGANYRRADNTSQANNKSADNKNSSVNDYRMSSKDRGAGSYAARERYNKASRVNRLHGSGDDSGRRGVDPSASSRAANAADGSRRDVDRATRVCESRNQSSAGTDSEQSSEASRQAGSIANRGDEKTHTTDATAANGVKTNNESNITDTTADKNITSSNTVSEAQVAVFMTTSPGSGDAAEKTAEDAQNDCVDAPLVTPTLGEIVYQSGDSWTITEQSVFVLHSAILVNYHRTNTLNICLSAQQMDVLIDIVRGHMNEVVNS